MTIEGEHQPCPDYPFELEGRANYKLANINHYGYLRNIEFVSSVEAHLSKELAVRMKSDLHSIHIRALNKTKIDSSISNLVNKMKGLSGALKVSEFSIMDVFKTPSKFFQGLWSDLKGYIEQVGILVGVVAVLFLLVLIMPALQILIIIVKIIGKGFKALKKLMNTTTVWLADKAAIGNKRKKRYWDNA